MRVGRDGRIFGMIVCAVSMLAGSITAQNWGPLTGVCKSDLSLQAKLQTLTAAAVGYGMFAPQVSVSPVPVTVGGIPAYEFDSSTSANANFSGYSTYDPLTGPGVAFNSSDWGDITPPPDPMTVVDYVATAYHELAHIVYEAYYIDWCSMHAAECAAFEACIATLDPPDDPCNEAFANGVANSSLCEDYQTVCNSNNPSLSVSDRHKILEAIEAQMALAAQECARQTADCINCSGPPMPPGYAGCGPVSCECNP